MIDPNDFRTAASRLVPTLALLLAGLAPIPAGWARNARETLRAEGGDRGESGGYYEELISGPARERRGALGPLETRLVGDPIAHNRGQVKQIVRDLPDDFLQFDLKPDYDRVFFDKRFATNSHGMRDREYAVEKPEGVFRIALLGASIDMGWGVSTDETYENLLEARLNAEAERRGIRRRFEVLNFAVVAYGPLQRYHAFREKATAFDPDMVLYSSTMLDPRLVEIHLGGLIKNGVDLNYGFYRKAVAESGIDPVRERSTGGEGYKAKVKDHYWSFADATLGALAGDCRSRGLPLVALLVPRASRDDADDARALAVARHAGIAARHAVPLIALSGVFDEVDPARVEIAPGDDHPNALGHRLLFEHLARALLDDPERARELFGESR